jgi:GTPase-activating protein BEM2
VVAEQLFVFHLKYLVAVDPAKDMSLLLDRTASQRFRSPLVFSEQLPHFLTRLVYTHVLGLDAPEASYDVSLRASFITHWIEIGQELKLRGDLAGFLAIAIAMLSIPILRLKETWTDVDANLRNMLIRDWCPMMKELHRRDLGGEPGSWTAHVLTPDLKREDVDSHLVIPYYGDICTSLEGFEIWAVIHFKKHAYNRLLLIWTSIFARSKKRLPP